MDIIVKILNQLDGSGLFSGFMGSLIGSIIGGIITWLVTSSSVKMQLKYQKELIDKEETRKNEIVLKSLKKEIKHNSRVLKTILLRSINENKKDLSEDEINKINRTLRDNTWMIKSDIFLYISSEELGEKVDELYVFTNFYKKGYPMRYTDLEYLYNQSIDIEKEIDLILENIN